MMRAYEAVLDELRARPRAWLVTGAGGFIGSHLVESLLALGQEVVGLDNFSTGFRRNLADIRARVREEAWERFSFVEGDIRDLECCRAACDGVDFVLHQAALGSVPRSINDPIATHENNVSGFVNMLVASRDAGVARFVYAASSSTYGDLAELPKVESRIGRPLSPYAVTKYANELYASVFASAYAMEIVGLRYFNVFGPRQDPNGAYAAVVPRWVANLIAGEACTINGDGETTRDFSFVANVVQANLLAALTAGVRGGDVFNVGCGERTTLNDLFGMIRDLLATRFPPVAEATPKYAPFRAGDVRHSQADITKIGTELGYRPTHRVSEGLAESLDWYVENLSLEVSGRRAGLTE